MLAFPSAHAADGVSAQQLLIVQTITLQGGKNDYGVAVLDGVQAYLAQVNRQGGIADRKVVVKVLDDDNKPAQAEANARELITKDKVFIVFGSIEGGPSNAVMKVSNELKVPFFGPMAGSPTFRAPHQPLVFPVRAEHKEEFRALLAHAKNLGMTRVAFLRSDSAVGQEHLANVRKIIQPLGLELAADLPFKSDINDAGIDAVVKQIASSGAQMVFNHGSTGIYEKIIRKAREQQLTTQFYGVNGLHPAGQAPRASGAQHDLCPGDAQPLGAQDRDHPRLPGSLQGLQAQGRLFIRQSGRLHDSPRTGGGAAPRRPQPHP